MWPLEGGQGFQEIWPSDLVFDPTFMTYVQTLPSHHQENHSGKNYKDWSKTVASSGEQGFEQIWPYDLVFDPT